MSYFKRLLELIGNHKGRFFAGLLFAFLKSFSFIFVFYALNISFINIDSITIDLVFKVFKILIIGVLFHTIFAYLDSSLLSAEAYHIYHNFRLDSGKKLKNAPLGYFDEQRLGNIQGSLTNMLTILENYTMMMVTNIINGFSIAIILTVAFFNIHYYLGLMMLPILLIAAFNLMKLYKTARKHVPTMHVAEQKMNFAVIDLIRGISVLKSFPIDDEHNLKKSIQNDAYFTYDEKRKVDIACENDYSWRAKIYTFCIVASSVFLILLTIILFENKAISLPDALTMIVGSFIIFLGLLPLSEGAFLYVKVPSNQRYIDEVLNIPQIKDGNLNDIEKPLDIEFDDVHFGYNNDREVIKGISFRIKEGQKVAIVGPSGSGKTTLVNIMARFWDVNSGSIKLGKTDIRNYKTEVLLKNLSMVFQDVYLFNDTIMNNIRFAKPEATDEEIYEVCNKARCHEFITNFKDGYETMVGEGGTNLSGGEKQRISIARALLKDAPIVLLDEATSSVDPENEAEILSAIDELCKNKTVISIAHRLSTVKDADNILVIDDGLLKEQGKHEELMKLDGIYARFVKSRIEAKGWRIIN